MRNDNKTCILCGKQYKYCEGCPGKYNVLETWRNIFCSENCREVYHVFDLLKAGKMTEKNANKELKKLDTSMIKTFKEPMKSMLTVVLNTSSNSDEIKPVEKVAESKEVKKEIPKEDKVVPPVKRRGRKKKDIEVN